VKSPAIRVPTERSDPVLADVAIRRFRHSAGFGKRIEFWVIGQMLKEGLDVYIPLVDDNAIDVVVRRKDGSFVEVQIKALKPRSLPRPSEHLPRFKRTD
jgi:hypothetical protein